MSINISKNPTEPGYIHYLIGQLQRKKLKYIEDIHRLQGKITGVDETMRQIKEDTDISISAATKEQEGQLTTKAQEQIKGIEKETEKKSKRIPPSKKKKGPSVIETLAPPINEEVPRKKPKRKRKK